ncbi:MAG TPA: hypothetical protein VGO52_16115 [Hyphomonadaceae bacterium]|jgi:hypothetical protein|nr:hypothetical protein [Hyphomonadaceae bacterium]
MAETLTVEIDPRTAAQLRQRAAEAGLTLEEYAQQRLKQVVAYVAGLTPEEREAYFSLIQDR